MEDDNNAPVHEPEESFEVRSPEHVQDQAEHQSPPPPRPSVFPEFHDGDVLILSPTGRTWKLHSLILSQASSKLKAILDEVEAIHITKKMRSEGKTIRYRLRMIEFEEDPSDLHFRTFKALDPSNKPHPMMMPENINGLGEEPSYNRNYNNFFKCLYNQDPDVHDRTKGNGAFYILDCIKLLEVAEHLGAAAAIRMTVEASLVRLNQVLWHHIADRAEAWVMIACRLKSPLMFREAMIHLVGKFHVPDGIDTELLRRLENGPVAETIWNSVTTKAKELKDKKLMIERRLLDYFPPEMMHLENETTVPGRSIYGEAIYEWQALTLFRQYVASAYMANYHHRANDGGIAFYRTIGDGGDTYLRPDTLARFHASFDMSAKGRRCLRDAVEKIKNEVKVIVAELLVDRSQAVRGPLDPRSDHLTCTEIRDEELPWYEAPVENAEVEVNMDRLMD